MFQRMHFSVVAVVTLVSLALTPGTAPAYLLIDDGTPKWGAPTFGTGAVVTWSLMPQDTDVLRRPPLVLPEEPFIFQDFWLGKNNINSIYAQLDPDPVVGAELFRNALLGAFAQWSAAANVTFVEVTDTGIPLGSHGSYAGLAGDIRIGAWSLAAPFDAFAGHSFQPPGGSSPGAGFLNTHSPSTFGDITLNTNAFFSVFPGLNEGDPYGGFPNDLQNLLTHEIGHALGLTHPELDGLDPSEVDAIMRAIAPLNIDRTLGADDIAGIQFIYGARAAGVPEPATLALWGLGVVACGTAGWRRARLRQM